MSHPFSYVEISKENLLHNLQVLTQSLAPGTKVAVAIKGNAYGHGQREVAEMLHSVDFLQVDDLEEVRVLSCITTPILLLGYTPQSQIAEVAKSGISVALFSLAELEQFGSYCNKSSQNLSIHLMVDTGLGREGLLPEEVPVFLDHLATYPNLKLEGVYSHFANVEDTSDPTHALKQIHLFNEVVAQVRARGLDPLTHISATGGVLLYESEEKNSLVRLGIGIYGMWPSEELQTRYQEMDIELRPVLRWVTHVAQVKTVPAKHPIGYGLTYITSHPTTIALIPQGYSDGYDRGFSNCGEVLIRGQRCHVLGRVAMNMFVVDVTHLAGVQVEDEVVLLGKQGNEEITAEELAMKLGTINYEITTRISPLLPRVVV